MSRRVVITGLGTVNALANNVPDFHLASTQGIEALTPFSDCLLQDPKYFAVGELKGASKARENSIERAQKLGQGSDQIDFRDYEACWVGAVRSSGQYASTKALAELARDSFGSWSKWAKRLDRFALLGVMASAEALQDAGLTQNGAYDPFRAAVLVSNTGLHLGLHERNQRILHHAHIANFEPLYILNGISNTVTGMISQVHDLRGPTFNCNAGNASSLASLQVGKALIEQNMADICLAGACESPLSKTLVWMQKNYFSGALSSPLSVGKQIFGEGAGVLCLEAREHALERGAFIYAELLGTAISSQGMEDSQNSEEAFVNLDSTENLENLDNLDNLDNLVWASLGLPRAAAIAVNLRRCISQVAETPERWHYCGQASENEALALCDIEAYLGENCAKKESLRREPSVQNLLGDCLSAAGAIDLIAVLSRRDATAKNILCYNFGWGGQHASAILRVPPHRDCGDSGDSGDSA